MCAWCGKILEHLYSRDSHGICPVCAKVGQARAETFLKEQKQEQQK
ncbi:hypothetical protein DBT_1443 [Dissulfuribacter thermophilus]|uniref:Uncharacterized protein n=1 Tax=Dissulfuribacter thermophilus TaxID=1156395 RepID=A0A1B9F5Y6_9BACT|nr:hypothetical protein [Dissulfuribacter thermophilus]OCC15320.1 hypothetical protein DBT_1443 [Dissulfuribacter thermophilus]